MNKLLLFFVCIALGVAVLSCSKKTTDTASGAKENVTVIGNLEPQGATTYQYGSHVLKMHDTVAYVLKSTAIELNKYEWLHVKISATNTHYHAEQGPELYDVTTIERMP